MRHYRSELINPLGLPVEDTLSQKFFSPHWAISNLEVLSDLGKFLSPNPLPLIKAASSDVNSVLWMLESWLSSLTWDTLREGTCGSVSYITKRLLEIQELWVRNLEAGMLPPIFLCWLGVKVLFSWTYNYFWLSSKQSGTWYFGFILLLHFPGWS